MILKNRATSKRLIFSNFLTKIFYKLIRKPKPFNPLDISGLLVWYDCKKAKGV